MPFIDLKTTAKISADKEIALKEALGKAIECIPGKNESWLMISFADEMRMWFKGTDEPCAMIEVKIFGSADSEYYNNMTAVLCDIMEKELAVPKNRTYVKYEEVSEWGWNGGNF